MDESLIMALPNEIGKRVRLVHTNDPYTRLKPNDEGTITDITELPENMGGHRQIWIKSHSIEIELR